MPECIGGGGKLGCEEGENWRELFEIPGACPFISGRGGCVDGADPFIRCSADEKVTGDISLSDGVKISRAGSRRGIRTTSPHTVHEPFFVSHSLSQRGHLMKHLQFYVICRNNGLPDFFLQNLPAHLAGGVYTSNHCDAEADNRESSDKIPPLTIVN